MSNASLILEDDFFNDTIHENIQTEEYNFISSSDPDSTKIEWRLPLAVIFAIIMIIYLVIVIVILSGSDISSWYFFNTPLSVSKRRYIGDTFPVISGFCNDLCGSCSHCSSCDYCSCGDESSSSCLRFLQFYILDPWWMCLRDIRYLCCHLVVCKYFQKWR